jgi:hypothetical protein
VDLVDARTDGLKLSLKLYHVRELQLDYQQSVTEAPAWRMEWPSSIAPCERNSNAASQSVTSAAKIGDASFRRYWVSRCRRKFSRSQHGLLSDRRTPALISSVAKGEAAVLARFVELLLKPFLRTTGNEGHENLLPTFGRGPACGHDE